jgi:hypothetical protein
VEIFLDGYEITLFFWKKGKKGAFHDMGEFSQQFDRNEVANLMGLAVWRGCA